MQKQLEQTTNTKNNVSGRSKNIVILGGGFAGINILRKTQALFKNESNVKIYLINENNFFLYTPMLPEVVSRMVRPSDISIPIRNFCKQANFIQSSVESIDLVQKQVTISRSFDGKVETIDYDYLVIGLGSKNHFYGNKNIEKHAFTIKSIEDAIGIRNHVVTMLEHADSTTNKNIQKKFMTFVVAGAGFAGVETIAELNHMIRDVVKDYPNILPENIKMILISAKSKILPEIDNKLSNFAMDYLKKSGIEVIADTKAIDADQGIVMLDNGTKIECHTFIWSGGVRIPKIISSIDCIHDEDGRIHVDKCLRLNTHPNVFAVGDCSSVPDPETGKSYPPTAQIAIHQSDVVVKNLHLLYKGITQLEHISYKNKGMMAIIGKRMAIVSSRGRHFRGLFAWLLWRLYYLMQIPTSEKRIKVALNWSISVFFKRDLSCFGIIKRKEYNQIDYDDLPPLMEYLFPELKEKSFEELTVE